MLHIKAYTLLTYRLDVHIKESRPRLQQSWMSYTNNIIMTLKRVTVKQSNQLEIIKKTLCMPRTAKKKWRGNVT